MKQYLIKYIQAIILLNLAVFFVNVIVDPYAIYDIVTVDGFNKNKPYQANYAQLYKPFDLYRNNPDIVIIGSSVAQNLFNPSKITELTNYTAYNFGIDGPTIYELYKFLGFTVRNTKSTKIIIGLEYMMFNGARGKHNTRFNLGRMNSTIVDNNFDHFSIKEIYDTLFSVGTFVKSINTIFSQNDTPFYDSNGFIPGQTAISDVNINLSKVFSITRKEYIDSFFINDNDNYFITKDGDNLFSYFRKILRYGYDSNVDIVLVISPMHQYFQEGLENKGLLDSYFEWRATINNILKEIAADNNKQEFLLLDYSVDKRNKEKITDLYGETMQYWNDAYHPSVLYGNEIIDQMLIDRKVFDVK